MLGGLAQTTGTGQSGPPLSNAGFNHPRVQRDWSDRTPPPMPPRLSLSPFSAETFSSRYQVVGKGRLNRLGEKRRQARPGLGSLFLPFSSSPRLISPHSKDFRYFLFFFFLCHAKQNEDSVRVEVGVLIQYRRGGVCARGNGHWRFTTARPGKEIQWSQKERSTGPTCRFGERGGKSKKKRKKRVSCAWRIAGGSGHGPVRGCRCGRAMRPPPRKASTT